MNTKIGTTFGLALLMAIGVIATMFALGMFSAPELKADHNTSSANVHVVEFTPSSTKVNAEGSWIVTFDVSRALVAGTGTIHVRFPNGVVLPTTMEKARVSAGLGTNVYPLTSDPTVSGQTVILTVPASSPFGSGYTGIVPIDGGSNKVTVFFSQLAGIVNPAKSGPAGKTASISTSAQTTPTGISNELVFKTTISLSKTSAAEGDEVVVTLGGFTPGLRVSLNGAVSGSAIVGSDRKATINGKMKGDDSEPVGASDGAFPNIKIDPADRKNITLKPTLTASTSGQVGEEISLKGRNFSEGSNIASPSKITFGGKVITGANTGSFGSDDLTPADHTDRDLDGKKDDFSVKFTIPSNAGSGVTQIKVTDASGKSATVTVDVLSQKITLSPSSGPPGTVVIITGSGFPKNDTTDADNKITLTPDFNSSGDITPGTSTVTGLFTEGAGLLSGSDRITIPVGAKTTDIKVEVEIKGGDALVAKGSATFTVTSRELTVVPTSGPKGTTILVTGTKFTSSSTVPPNSITVDGKATTHSLANLTSAGDVAGISLKVPSASGLGSVTVSLEDTGVSGTNKLKGSTKFTVTVPTISLGSTTAHMGEDVQVTGGGWVPSSSVTISVKSGSPSVAVAIEVTVADALGAIDTLVTLPRSVGVGPQTITFEAADAATFGNSAAARYISVPKPEITLSHAEAVVGDTVIVEATGFTPSSGLSRLEIGGADVRSGVVTSNSRGELTTSFTVPGLFGSQIVTVKIGSTEVSTSISLITTKAPAAASTGNTEDIFADVISNDDNLVRVWRFSNADQSWAFYDPRDAFAVANTLVKIGAGDIVWVNVNTEQEFQEQTLFPGWNQISLK